MSSTKLKDNFLKDEDFESLTELVFSEPFPWFYTQNITYKDEKTLSNFCYLTHILYRDDHPNSLLYNKIIHYFDFYKCLWFLLIFIIMI